MISGVIVARMLGPENRGYLALLILVPLIVAQVGGLGVPLSLTYYIARDPSAGKAIWRSIRPVALFQAGLLAGVHCLVLWALLRDEPGYVVDAALVTVALVPATLAQEYGLAMLQGCGRFVAFNVIRLLSGVLYSAGLVLLLVLDADRLQEVAVTWTATLAGVSVVTMAIATRGLGSAPDATAPTAREMISFGAKGLLGSNSPIEYYRLDQAVVGLFLTPAALGVYAVALSFTNLPRFVSSAVGMVAYPHVAGQSDPAEGRRKLWRFFFVTVAACLAIVVVLELSAGFLVPFFFGDEFADSVPLVRILLVAALLLAARRILADGARGLGLPGLGTVAELVSIIVLVPAVAVFLPLWGVEGVAVAMVAAALASLPVILIGLARSGGRPRGTRHTWRVPRLSAPAGGLRSTAVVLALVLAVDALAVAATVLSPALAGWFLAISLTVLGVVVVRACLVPSFAKAGSEERIEPVEPAGSPGDPLKGARRLYYLGLLLLGFIVLRPVGGVTLSDLIFLAAFGLTMLTLAAVRGQATAFPGPVMLLGVALFAAGGLLSSFGAPSSIDSLTVVARVVYLTVIWFWLGSVLLTEPRHLYAAIGCWVASAALGGAGAIAQTLWGDVIPGGEVHFGRVSGITFNINDLGGLCGVALIPAVMLVATARSLTGRIAATVGMLLIVAGVLLSGSVSGVGAAVVAGAVWVSITRPTLRVVIPLMAVVLALPAFASEHNRYWQSPLERFATSSQQSGTADATLQTRLDAGEAAWETIQDSPLIGVGLAREAPDTDTGLAVHNMFLGTWYQAGLLAALGLIVIAAAALAMGWQAVTDARDRREHAVAVALFSSVLAFLFFGQAQEVLFQRYGWVAVALLTAMRAQQRARRTAFAGTALRSPPSLSVPARTA